jgi:hypothetical protein
MGGKGSKPIEDAFCEDNVSILSEIKYIECFNNNEKNIKSIYICIIFIILLIVGIHFLHRRL